MKRAVLAAWMAAAMFGGLQNASAGWWAWLAPDRDARRSPTATDLMEKAQSHRLQGRLRAAGGLFERVLEDFADSPEAPDAQVGRAELYEHQGRWKKAFEAYETLLEEYPGQGLETGEVLRRQLHLADLIGRATVWGDLGLPGLRGPERPLPMLEKIEKAGPSWDHIAYVDLAVGKAREDAKDWDEAIVAYDRCVQRAPMTPYGAEAAFRRAYCYARMSDQRPADLQLCRVAKSHLAFFIKRFGGHPRADAAAACWERLVERDAVASLRAGRFYDGIAGKPESAVIAYEDYIREFPRSEHADSVRQRVRELRREIGRGE